MSSQYKISLLTTIKQFFLKNQSLSYSRDSLHLENTRLHYCVHRSLWNVIKNPETHNIKPNEIKITGPCKGYWSKISFLGCISKLYLKIPQPSCINHEQFDYLIYFMFLNVICHVHFLSCLPLMQVRLVIL
jgi:hypothetical protein